MPWNPFKRREVVPVIPKDVEPAPMPVDIELIQLKRLQRRFEMNRVAEEALCRIRGGRCPE